MRKKRRLNEEILNKEEEEEAIINDARERQIFDPGKKIFDYTKRRVTDLKENSFVKLPKGTDSKLENELGMIRELIMREFSSYKTQLEKREAENGKEEKKRINQ